MDVRAELATSDSTATPPRALAVIAVKRDKPERQVSPGMRTANLKGPEHGPEPKRAMLEDSGEEEDGADADVRRWMEAEFAPGGGC